jgi:uncharacterized membrane protein YciS (DUF1049 family)
MSSTTSMMLYAIVGILLIIGVIIFSVAFWYLKLRVKTRVATNIYRDQNPASQ